MITISLIIPTYNESDRIRKTIQTLKKGLSFSGIKFEEIIFSDDGSTDETVKLLKKAKKTIARKTKAKIKILSYQKNKGRGFAIRAAAQKAIGNYILYTDADFSIPLENLKRFIPYMKKNYDIIIGSKKIKGAKEIVKRSFVRKLIGYCHSFIVYLILGVFFWDFQGGFKVFSRRFVNNIFPSLQIDRWGFDMEVIFLAKKLGYRIKELPVRWGHIENGSKVKLLRDIFRSLQEMFQIKTCWLEEKYQKKIVPRLALSYS